MAALNLKSQIFYKHWHNEQQNPSDLLCCNLDQVFHRNLDLLENNLILLHLGKVVDFRANKVLLNNTKQESRLDLARVDLLVVEN